jgi:hypothetical protein
MGFTLPPGITLNFRKWTVRERLYPPKLFTPGIQDNLLARLNTCDKSFDDIAFIWTANVCRRDLDHLNGRYGRSLSGAATAHEKTEEKKKSPFSAKTI